MQNQVIAEIEIGDQKIEHYSSVSIRQQFNAHHQFAIRIKYDVLEPIGSFSLSNAQKMIGKSAIIKLKQANTLEIAYEFRGLICEITMEQGHNFTSDLVLKGYSPTILLENGGHLVSFYKKNLQQIVQQLTQSVAQNYCEVQVNPLYKTSLPYLCQYRESAFHFLNRLSSDFNEWFYYDGSILYFGKPSTSPTVDITHGEDVNNIQLTLRILPMAFSGYAYVAKNDDFISYNAPSGVDGLDEYASYVLQESNKVFSDPVNSPLRQRVVDSSELQGFVKMQKAAIAADLEVLTGSSDNPTVCIGAIASVKFSRLEDNSFKKEDYGKFLITSIEHYITENGKYQNNFEAIPSGLEVIPVKNIIMPIAETQIATVTDNKDPDNVGRVRVQMLWQQPINEMTGWIRVMTPDAGPGKDSAKNRGLVCIPETGDQVLVCFRYNDPDRPFVLGSLFQGKTGAGGGDDNKTKSFTVLSGSTIVLKDKSISIIDADEKSKVLIDGDGKINIESSESITLKSGESSIEMKKDGTINIKGKQITIDASEKAKMVSGQAAFTADGNSGDAKMEGMKVAVSGSTEAKVDSNQASFTADGNSGDAKIEGINASVSGTAQVKISSNAQTEVSSSGIVTVKGATIMLN